MTNRESILIVDDDPEVTSVLPEFLEQEGYVVTAAHTGAEGLRLIQRVAPSLLLLDLQLSDVAGSM